MKATDAVRLLGAVAAALLCLQRPARAQAEVTVSGLVGYAGSATTVQGVTEQGSGLWYGMRVDLRVGPFGIEASGLKGPLDPEGSGMARDGGEMRAALRLHLASWLALEGGYSTRAFNSPAGYQKWTFPDLGARVIADLGSAGLRSYVRGSYLPGASAEGLPASTLGLAVEAGLRWEAPGGWLSFGAFYRLERFDFGTSPGSRLEQFDVLGASLGVRLGRR